MMTDPIADMLTRIRNANAIRRKSVVMPASKIKVGIAEVLKSEGFIAGYRVTGGRVAEGNAAEGSATEGDATKSNATKSNGAEGTSFSSLELELKFGPDGEDVIRTIDRVSKPGCRFYTGVKDMPHALRGLGIYVLSTPRGVLSDRAARKENVGGEILCKVC